ncbi:hypothetical protein ACIQ6Y_33305 [Streptomyces sp. NPDC096205]|uniref:hypothetical protein n=1 Tax=Streptomyces sp. NPDC096205 TaxID=3366081 RepID=UPI00381D75E0
MPTGAVNCFLGTEIVLEPLNKTIEKSAGTLDAARFVKLYDSSNVVHEAFLGLAACRSVRALTVHGMMRLANSVCSRGVSARRRGLRVRPGNEAADA